MKLLSIIVVSGRIRLVFFSVAARYEDTPRSVTAVGHRRFPNETKTKRRIPPSPFPSRRVTYPSVKSLLKHVRECPTRVIWKICHNCVGFIIVCLLRQVCAINREYRQDNLEDGGVLSPPPLRNFLT